MELDLIGLLERGESAPMTMDSLEVVEECGVDVRLELSLGLSYSDAECRKRERESKETDIVKKPKMKEGPMPSCLHVMPMTFMGPKGYCWIPISMEVVGNNLHEPRDNPSLALETDGVDADDWKVEVVGESRSSESPNSGTSVLQLFC